MRKLRYREILVIVFRVVWRVSSRVRIYIEGCLILKLEFSIVVILLFFVRLCLVS